MQNSASLEAEAGQSAKQMPQKTKTREQQCKRNANAPGDVYFPRFLGISGSTAHFCIVCSLSCILACLGFRLACFCILAGRKNMQNQHAKLMQNRIPNAHRICGPAILISLKWQSFRAFHRKLLEGSVGTLETIFETVLKMLYRKVQKSGPHSSMWFFYKLQVPLVRLLTRRALLRRVYIWAWLETPTLGSKQG